MPCIAEIRPRTLDVFGRRLEVAKTCGGVLDADFSELCARPLGASDYIVLSQVFHTVLVRDIPVFGMHQLGEARRFITMIDTFYDHKVRAFFWIDTLICKNQVADRFVRLRFGSSVLHAPIQLNYSNSTPQLPLKNPLLTNNDC